MKSYRSSGNSSIGEMCYIPAMLARYRIEPSSTAASIAPSAAASSVRSHDAATVLPSTPIESAISIVSSSPISSISRPATVNPLAAKATAVACPIPEAAPVTTATLSVVNRSSSTRRTCSAVSSGGATPSERSSLIEFVDIIPSTSTTEYVRDGEIERTQSNRGDCVTVLHVRNVLIFTSRPLSMDR